MTLVVNSLTRTVRKSILTLSLPRRKYIRKKSPAVLPKTIKRQLPTSTFVQKEDFPSVLIQLSVQELFLCRSAENISRPRFRQWFRKFPSKKDIRIIVRLWRSAIIRSLPKKVRSTEHILQSLNPFASLLQQAPISRTFI